MLLSGGTFISQLIPFLCSPVLSRLYSPEQFGLLELILRISSFFAVIATLRLDLAIPLPKEEEKAKNLLVLSVLSSFLVSLISLIIFVLLRKEITYFLRNEEVGVWLLFLPIMILLSGLAQSWSSLLLRMNRFKLLGITKAGDSIVNNAGKISAAAISGATNSAFILPNFFGMAIASALPLIYIRSYLLSAFRNVKTFNLKATLKEFSDFPRVNLLNAILDGIQIALTVFLISRYFGTVALGLYALKLRILKTPALIIGTSAGQIFYSTASKLHAAGENISALFRRYLIFFIIIGVVLFTPFALFGPLIFSAIFGHEWEVAGLLARYSSGWMFMNFLASALSYLPFVVKKQRSVLKLSFLNFILVTSSIVISYNIFMDFVMTIIVLSVVEMIYFLFVNIWYYHISRNY